MNFRAATLDDAALLFEWRNDILTRDMSLDSELVEWSAHLDWLHRRLGRDEPGLYIVEVEGVPVGTIRLDGDEISYTVAPERRNEGIATAMLTEARTLFGSKRALIKPKNIASIKAAQTAGHVVILLPDTCLA